MAKRRKRRSAKDLTARAMKDIRQLHRDHLREISAILTNTLGFPVRVSMVPVREVLTPPRKKGGTVTRKVAHVAGTGRDLDPRFDHVEPRGLPSDDEVGL